VTGDQWITVIGLMALMFLGGISAGVGIGWYLYHPINNLSIEDLRQELDSRLSFEEADAAERKLRAEMVANGRREIPRPNAGQTTRITQIRVKRDG